MLEVTNTWIHRRPLTLIRRHAWPWRLRGWLPRCACDWFAWGSRWWRRIGPRSRTGWRGWAVVPLLLKNRKNILNFCPLSSVNFFRYCMILIQHRMWLFLGTILLIRFEAMRQKELSETCVSALKPPLTNHYDIDWTFHLNHSHFFTDKASNI